MTNQDNKTFVETVLEAQKNAVDTMVENTRRMTNGNAMVTDTVQKSSEWYKNWLDTQKQFFNQTAEQATTAAEGVKDNASKMNEFYQNWFNQQMAWGKQMWDTTSGWMKNSTQTQMPQNPMEAMTQGWNTWMNQWTNMWNGANTMNQWMNQMQSMNPFNMDAWKNASGNWTGIFNQWYELLNNSFGDLQQQFSNGTMQDAYRNMLNSTEGFTRFYEMWMPMWKSIQDKTFNMDLYKQWMNPAQYKTLMDQYFGFMPEQARNYMQQMGTMMQDGMKQMSTMAMGNYNQLRQSMGTMMPWMNGTNAFESMLNGYNNLQNMFQSAVSPIARMVTPNQYTKAAMEWQDIANRMTVWSIKNAEMQYMVYLQGSKVMDQLASNVMTKIQNGEEISSMMALYQEWMSISDKTFVQLFESDDYSRLMAEVSAMQLKLKKDIELQMEKMMTGVPVATRSEMDELYKTIYDLKKQVRQLEKMLEVGEEEGTNNTEAPEANNNIRPNNRGKKA